MNLDWLWLWAQDDSVWEWIRTVSAALFGALVGGLFTLRGQNVAARVQSARDEAARMNALEDQRRSYAAGEVLSLFREFVALQRDIDGAADDRGDDERRPWTDIWEGAILPKERKNILHTQAELIPDATTRTSISAIVGWLWMAPEYSREGFGPGMTNYALPRLARILTGEAIAVLGAYLRHDPVAPSQHKVWDQMRVSDQEYDEWVEEQETARVQWEAERLTEMARERTAQSEARKAKFFADKESAAIAAVDDTVKSNSEILPDDRRGV